MQSGGNAVAGTIDAVVIGIAVEIDEPSVIGIIVIRRTQPPEAATVVVTCISRIPNVICFCVIGRFLLP